MESNDMKMLYEKAVSRQILPAHSKKLNNGILLAGLTLHDLKLGLLASFDCDIAIRKVEELFYSLITPPLNINCREANTVFQSKSLRSIFKTKVEQKSHVECIDCGQFFKDGLALSEHWAQRHHFQGFTNDDVQKLIPRTHNDSQSTFIPTKYLRANEVTHFEIKTRLDIAKYHYSHHHNLFKSLTISETKILPQFLPKLISEVDPRMRMKAFVSSAANNAEETQIRHSCPKCGKIWLGVIRELKIHLERHCPKTPHKCKFCGKHFTRKGSLRSHQDKTPCQAMKDANIAIDMPYKCPKCEMTFSVERALKKHKSQFCAFKVDHAKNDANEYICECGYTHEQHHRFIHHKQYTCPSRAEKKLAKCPDCGNQVKFPNLRKHQDNACPVRKAQELISGTFSCPICHKPFYSWNALSNHRRNVAKCKNDCKRIFRCYIFNATFVMKHLFSCRT